MEPRLMRNREALLDLLLPILAEWAAVEGYVMPSVHYLLKFDVELNGGGYLSRTGDLVTLANCDQSRQLVRIAMDRSNHELISTMTHEYAHAVQFYNLGARFMPQYSEETERLGYDRNKFEVQARGAQQCFEARCRRDTFLHRAVEAFKWLRRAASWVAFDPEDLDCGLFFEKPRFKDWEHHGFWFTHHERRR